MIDDGLLTFDHAANPPTANQPIIRDDEEVLIAAGRSCNADSEWQIRGYSVYGEGVRFKHGLSVEQADLAAVFCELFDGDDLTTTEEYAQHRPVRYGVPTAVAVDGKPAVAAWLRVRGEDREEIAETMGVGARTVREYLHRFRRRGVGIPDEVDAPEPGEIMPSIPPAMDYSGDGPRGSDAEKAVAEADHA